MNTGMPAAYLGVLVEAKGIGRTNAQLMRTHGVLGSVGGAATRMGRQFLTGLKYMSLGAIAGVAAAGKLAISFDKEMRNVNSIAQLGEKAFGKLRARVLALAGPTAQAPKTLAAGLYDLVSSGFDSSESIQILAKSARAATAGLTTTEISTKAVAAVLNAYHLSAGKAGDTSDVLFEIVNRGVISFEELAQNIGDVLPFGSSLGVNLREVGASIATMTKAGISAPETMTRIKAVMVTLLKPSEDLKNAIKAQGYESGEAMVKALGLQGTLDALAKTTDGNKEKMAALFPNIRALGGALALTGENSKGAQEDLKGMQDASGATAKALSQQSRSISYQWQQLRSTAEALAIKFGSQLLPELNAVMKIISDPNLTTEEKVTKVFDHILRRAEEGLKAGVDMAKQYGPKIIGTLVSSMAGAWWDMNGLGKVLGLAALVRVLGGKGALAATGKAIGRMLGLGVSEGMATTMATGAPVAAGVTANGASKSTTAAAPALWTPAAASASRVAAEKSATTFMQGWTSRIKAAGPRIIPAVKSVGANFARGLTTWGLGGLVVGGMTKELVRGDTGQKIGSALEGAGLGAAIGSAIAPGIGTAIGAGVGAGAVLIQEQLNAEGIGGALGIGIAEDLEGSLGGRLQKALNTRDLGALGGLTKQIRGAIKAAISQGADAQALAPLRKQLNALLKARDLIDQPRDVALDQIGVLRSGLATRLSDINDLFQSNLEMINRGWVQGTGRWRAITAQNMDSAIAAIRNGMRQGVIETDAGQQRIKELMRGMRLVEGRDPYGIAEGFASSWKQAGQINNSKIDAMIREMQRMPKGSREAAQDAMVQMAKALENKGELVKGSASRLQSALVTKFGKTNAQLVGGVVKAGDGIAAVFANLVNSASGYLGNLGENVNSILKAFGVSQAVNFTVKTAKVGASAAGAVGRAVGDVVGSVTGKQTGGFIVPGVGSGDRPGFTGEVGAFVLNREATRAYGFDRGGLVPLALESGERYFSRPEVRAMGGASTLEAMNRSVPRFQNGGEIGKPSMAGPAGPLTALGQAAVTKPYEAAREYIASHKPKAGLAGLGNAPADLREAMALAQSKGLTITSTTGGEHAANSWHYKGRAFDASNGTNTPQEREYALTAASKWGRKILELFFDPLGWYIKNGQKISGTIGGHSDHVHTAMQLGGLIRAMARGGSLAENFQDKAQRVWRAAAPLYGASPEAPMPRTLVTGNKNEVIPFEDGSRGVHIARWNARDFLQGRDWAEGTLLHEWVHRFQRGLGHLDPTLREGGAEAFERWAAPQVYGSLGMPFLNQSHPNYPKAVAKVIAEKGWDWIKHGQFLASGGFVDASATQENVALQIGRELLGRGLNYKGAAGVIGNAWRESLWNPASIGTGGRGLYGFDFFEQQLLEQAEQRGVSWTSIPFQNEFMWSGPEPASKLKGALNSQPSAAAAAKLFDSKWERSGVKAMSDRMNGAREAMRLMTGSDMEAVGGTGAAEGKQRRGNYEQRLKTLQQEASQAKSVPAQQSKLWRLIKFWGRVGMFDKDERSYILDAVQNAAAQTKPQGAVNILQRLAGYASSHGEITGQDPSNFHSMEKAIERAQDRGREQRTKAVENHKRHVEGIHKRVEGRIAKRAAFPDWVQRLEGLRSGADIGEEFASQLVTLEPENLNDAYVNQERGAYGDELTRLLSWRNSTVKAQDFASAEIGRFEKQIADIEALKPDTPQNGKVFADLIEKAGGKKGKKALGGLVQELAKGGKAGGGWKPPAGAAQDVGNEPDTSLAAYNKQKSKIPLLEQAITDAKTMRDETWVGELEEIQGLSGPKGILDSLPSEPTAGAFGGRIFEVQNSIRELALKVNDAASGISEMKDLEAQLNTDWHKRFLVSEAQRNTISDFNSAYSVRRFAGPFATGGTIGAGQWGIAGETGEPEIVHGPARVFSPSESEAMMSSGAPRVIINGDIVQAPGDTRDPVELVIGDRRFAPAVQKATRDGRVTGRPTSGGAR